MNVLIAKTLGFQRLLWVPCRGKTLEELVDSLYLAYDSFKVKDVEVLAIIANKVQLENIKLVTDGLRSSLPTETLVNAIFSF
jgi:phosphate acetyltransferase